MVTPSELIRLRRRMHRRIRDVVAERRMAVARPPETETTQDLSPADQAPMPTG